LRPRRWAISARVALSPFDSCSRPLICARNIRFSATRYSLRRSSSWLTFPLM
jgi:hypothetical protein